MARFRVTGRGEFPTDMLRKDRCWYATAADAYQAGEAGLRRTIELETDEKFATNARWNSFGWDVVGVDDNDWLCGCDRVYINDIDRMSNQGSESR